jgi:hypothetical protein
MDPDTLVSRDARLSGPCQGDDCRSPERSTVMNQLVDEYLEEEAPR